MRTISKSPRNSIALAIVAITSGLAVPCADTLAANATYSVSARATFSNPSGGFTQSDNRSEDNLTRIENLNTVGGVFKSSSANLAAGTLRAVIDGLGFGHADASFMDTVTITGLTAPTEVSIHLRVNGVVQTTQSGNAGANAQLALLEPGTLNGLSQVTHFYPISNGVTTINDLLSVTFFVSPESPSFAFSAAVHAGTDALSSVHQLVDLGHTAVFDIDLPSQLAFISASNVLLTQPVPIPPSLGLMLGALFTTVATAVKRKAR